MDLRNHAEYECGCKVVDVSGKYPLACAVHGKPMFNSFTREGHHLIIGALQPLSPTALPSHESYKSSK